MMYDHLHKNHDEKGYKWADPNSNFHILCHPDNDEIDSFPFQI